MKPRKPTDGRILTPLFTKLLRQLDNHPDAKRPLRPYEAMRVYLQMMLAHKKTLKIDWVEAEDLVWFFRVAEKRYYKK